MGTLKDICFDCADPWMLSHWWAEVLDYRVRPYSEEDVEHLRREGIDRVEDDPNIAIDPIGEAGPSFWFCRVPEPKAVKNRIHVDVYGDVDELLRRGAVRVSELPGWTVLADPEGNEFCVFAPTASP